MAIADPANDVLVSAATAWEIAIKTALGRLAFPLDRLEGVLARMGIVSLPISLAHALAAGGLPRHHDDPFDRILVAQTIVEGFRLLTADRRLTMYSADVVTL